MMSTSFAGPPAAAMPGATPGQAVPETLAELHQRLGGVPLERIRCRPAPGTATEADVLLRPEGQKQLLELIDGVLVEKPMGYYESRLAAILIYLLEQFLEQHDLGVVSGPDATFKLAEGLVRLPDVAFVSWERFPSGKLPAEAVPAIVPDLAVEVLSEGNTEAEMQRKLQEYFAAGVRLVWLLDPALKEARADTSPTEFHRLSQEETLEGDPVLPGFRPPLRDWFQRAERGRGRDYASPAA